MGTLCWWFCGLKPPPPSSPLEAPGMGTPGAKGLGALFGRGRARSGTEGSFLDTSGKTRLVPVGRSHFHFLGRSRGTSLLCPFRVDLRSSPSRPWEPPDAELRHGVTEHLQGAVQPLLGPLEALLGPCYPGLEPTAGTVSPGRVPAEKGAPAPSLQPGESVRLHSPSHTGHRPRGCVPGWTGSWGIKGVGGPPGGLAAWGSPLLGPTPPLPRAPPSTGLPGGVDCPGAV